VSGKRYRQRRRFMRTWGGHPEAGRLWANHGGHQGLQRDWCVQYLDMAVKLQQTGLFGPSLYSTPMGYADPLNRDPALEARYGLSLGVRQPGPALRGITVA